MTGPTGPIGPLPFAVTVLTTWVMLGGSGLSIVTQNITVACAAPPTLSCPAGAPGLLMSKAPAVMLFAGEPLSVVEPAT